MFKEWIVLMSLTLIVYLSKCEQACFALFSYHVFDILRLVMWIWYWLRWKGYGKKKKKINSFFVVWSYGCFFHMRFGPTKKLFKFIVKLCFIWSLMLNVQGMNCFEKKKSCIKPMGGFGPLGNLFFFFFFFLFSSLCFDDGCHDKFIMKCVFICSFGVLGLFVMNIWSLFGNLVISIRESLK